MQLSKICRYPLRQLTNKPYQAFGGGAPQNTLPKEEINDEDLQGMNEFYAYKKSPDSIFGAPNLAKRILGRLPFFTEAYAQEFQDAKYQPVSESWVPPKSHENSVFIYQDGGLGNELKNFGAFESFGLAAIIFGTQYPIMFVPYLAMAYVMYGRSKFYELRNRTVVRMDLLPHVEMLEIQKQTIFGITYSKLVRTDQLEKVEYSELQDKENLFWGLNRKHLEEDLMYRDK
mmetsp:Transcript_22685/g.19701  ORF Transcript_22685/g.19701 Transcript_22685/m.19701 type:complete len:230 (-) Transcript_22685:271-960(-)